MARLHGENSLKLFKICIFSFIIEVIGLALIGFMILRTIYLYKNYVVPQAQNLRLIHSISKNVSEEQSISALFVLSTEEEFLPEYSERELELHYSIIEELNVFEKRMKGRTELYQTFHDIDSLCSDIFSKIEIAMTLRKNGFKEAAERYISKDLQNSFFQVNGYLVSITEQINADIASVQRSMMYYTRISNTVVAVDISILILTVLCLIIVCVNLTDKLEMNKDKLQEEVSKKTEKIIAQAKHLQYIQEQTILGMANIIESRDSETGEHVMRTSQYVEVLANAALEYGYLPEILTSHYIDILKRVAPMHDIGKIAVSDAILKKPAKLTPEEFEKIKIHTTVAERIIFTVLGKIETEEYVKTAIDVAKSHHERWDGNGYPNHLKGEAIPLSARIMAIADVFDALVSERCYKKAVPPEEAFEIISESSGTHFDPILVDLFLKKKDEVLKIMESK